MQHRNIDLYSCIASDSQQFFKRVFYLKQIIVIMGGRLSGGTGATAPVSPPLIWSWFQLAILAFHIRIY